MSISRRDFVKQGSVWIAAAAAGFDLACRSSGAAEAKAAGSAASPALAASASASASSPGAAASSSAPPSAAVVCRATAPNIEGPYYRDGAPMLSDLAPRGTRGTRLLLSGKVLGADCRTPLDGALLDVWQADADGHYDNDGHDGRRSPGPLALRGKLSASRGGAYELHSIIPGRYLNGPQYRPSHVHVKVSAPGYRTLTTQLYFDGDPYNGVDPFIDQSLVMKLEDAPGAKRASFDFVLARA